MANLLLQFFVFFLFVSSVCVLRNAETNVCIPRDRIKTYRLWQVACCVPCCTHTPLIEIERQYICLKLWISSENFSIYFDFNSSGLTYPYNTYSYSLHIVHISYSFVCSSHCMYVVLTCGVRTFSAINFDLNVHAKLWIWKFSNNLYFIEFATGEW